MSGIICYENVDICYNGSPVIKKVSFSAEKGEILGIAGESGSGKSTLIKAAIGLLGKNGSVTGGKIWYEEKNLLDLNEKELRKICGSEIGMIFFLPDPNRWGSAAGRNERAPKNKKSRI